jgi:hypothetical protein
VEPVNLIERNINYGVFLLPMRRAQGITVASNTLGAQLAAAKHDPTYRLHGEI